MLATLLVAGALLLALREPWRRPVLVQAVLTTVLTLGLFTVALLTHPTVALVPVGVIAGLILASYPNPHGVASVRPDAARHRAVLVTTFAAAPVLLFDAAENIGRQLTDGSEHALWGHWSGAAALAIVLLLPDHDGSWGVAGGVLALLAASAYAATVARAGATAQRW